MTMLNNTRIAIIEDNVTNMAVYAATLERLGARIIQDPWQYKTVEIFRTYRPDIILLDLMLHNGVSGYDIYDELQADSDLKTDSRCSCKCCRSRN